MRSRMVGYDEIFELILDQDNKKVLRIQSGFEIRAKDLLLNRDNCTIQRVNGVTAEVAMTRGFKSRGAPNSMKVLMIDRLPRRETTVPLPTGSSSHDETPTPEKDKTDGQASQAVIGEQASQTEIGGDMTDVEGVVSSALEELPGPRRVPVRSNIASMHVLRRFNIAPDLSIRS